MTASSVLASCHKRPIRGIFALVLEIGAREPIIDSDVACFRPSGRLQPFAKGRDAGACFRIILGEAQQEADPPNMLCLLCDDFKRPSSRTTN